MKHIFQVGSQIVKTAAVSGVVLFASSFAPQESNKLTVEVVGARNDKGNVLIALHDKADGFPEKAEKHAVGKAKVRVVNGKAVAEFDGLKSGSYAISVMHDENDNLKMDNNMVGMPKEGYGFSNNAKGIFGPPSFEKAAFQVNSTAKKVSIKLNYL